MGLTITQPATDALRTVHRGAVTALVAPGIAFARRSALLRTLAGLCVVSVLALPCPGADSHEAFLEGLRQRGYFDTALQYLSSLESAPETSDDVRATVELEKALIWMDRRAVARRRNDQLEYSDQARRSFEGFLRSHPQHDRAAWAHSQLGRLLFDQARQKIWASAAASEADQREPLTEEAGELLQEARQSFGTARDQFKTRLDSLPFVDREEDEQAWETRRRTEVRYLSAWLSLINCLYEEAVMAPENSRRRSGLLTSALEQYQQIDTYSRASAAGQHARLMMGKCRQELGDISEALGFFDELRNQPSQDPYMQRLSRTAQYYRLICLNHESRAEHHNVVTEATRWLRAHETDVGSEAGLGILYEKAVASEALAREEGLSDEQRELRLRQALADLEQVSAIVSPVQQPARVAARRIRDELGEARRDPVKFETAFDRGRELVGRLQDARSAVRQAATDDERQLAEQELELLTSEAGRMFQLALQLREPDSSATAVAQAGYLLSYVCLQQRKSYDAFVLARHVMRRHSADAAETAADATEMAISAAVQIWSSAPEDNRDFELNLVREICEEVIAAFPGSRPATEARMRLGRIYRDLDQPRRAAEAFLQIPREDARYAEARMEAGQAWWLTWAQAGSRQAEDAADAVNADTLEAWKQQARRLLTEGIELSRAAQQDGSLSDEIIRAEVSLCGLLNQEGEFSQTMQRLTTGSPSVMTAIEMEGDRPERGVRSAAFAGLCYRTLLRACVGAREIDEALAVMQRLQALGSSNTTAVYTQLGRELQRELEQLQQSGDEERLRQVRASFEDFLEQIYQSRDRSNVGALLWIGETCAGLARSANSANESQASLEKAATVFQELLDADIDAATETAVSLRLIRIYRELRRYQAAVDLGTQQLTVRPASVSVQLEVAHTLADWGENGEPDRLLQSISGVPSDQENKTIWGWAALSRRLQRSQGQPNWPDLQPLFLESRYELSNSRLRYARVNPDQGRKQLEAAARELTLMGQISADLDDDWWSRFDQLYQDVNTRLGRPAVSLARPHSNAGDASNGAEPPQNGAPTGDSSAVAATSPDSAGNDGEAAAGVSRMTWLMTGIGLMALIVGGISLVVMKQPRRRGQRSYGGPPAEFRLPGGTAIRAESVPPAKRRPSSAGAPAAGSAAAQPPRTGPRRKRPQPTSKTGRPTDSNPPTRKRKPPAPPPDE